MALKKLNKGEISALSNKIKEMMRVENEKVRMNALANETPAIEQQARWIDAEIKNLSTSAQAFLHSTKSYKAGITYTEIVEFLENQYVKTLLLPYNEPEENWRGESRIEETIILAQLEADDVDGLIEAVKKAFAGE